MDVSMAMMYKWCMEGFHTISSGFQDPEIVFNVGRDYQSTMEL